MILPIVEVADDERRRTVSLLTLIGDLDQRLFLAVLVHHEEGEVQRIGVFDLSGRLVSGSRTIWPAAGSCQGHDFVVLVHVAFHDPGRRGKGIYPNTLVSS